MTTQNIRFLIKTANLYYKEGLSQAEIAKQLGTSRASIGRALKTAQEQGYVRIVFDFPAESHFSIDLERQLENKLNMKEVIIAENTDDIANEASLFLARTIKNKDSIGLTWGRTMETIVNTFDKNILHRDIKVSNVEIIPLTGTSIPSTANVDDLRLAYSSLLASKLANTLKGRSYPFPAPLYVRNKTVKDILLKEPEIKNILEKGTHCNMAVFGIGLITEHSSITALDPDMSSSILELSEKGAIGEIMGHPFDKNGVLVPNEVSERIIGISLEHLKEIPKRIAVAYGNEKAQAIHAVCKSGLANILITDAQTALSLLNL
jgi:deoxyribonucleoside regulator